MDRQSSVSNFTLTFALRAQQLLMPYMRYQEDLEQRLGNEGREKEPGHMTYPVDLVANELLFEMAREHDIGSAIFSEESGWQTVGNRPRFKIICDPFCNTSLAISSFRESAVAICMTGSNNEFISCAIADLNVDRVFFADSTGAYVVTHGTAMLNKKRISVSKTKRIEEAFVVMSIMKRERRAQVGNNKVFLQARQFHGLDGAIFFGRLAAGYIDAYLDPLKGQPLYEVPCAQLVLAAGGVVSDSNGVPFELGYLIEALEENVHARYKIVAASTRELHQELLEALM